MDHNLTPLLAGCIAFVGTHFALSHPLRAPLVKVFGENGFLGLYSLTALATFGWMIAAFRAAGPVEGQLWDGGNGFFWLVSSLLTFVALALLLGSLRGNPALPQTSASTLTTAS